MKTYLFLDIDGVLNSWEFHRKSGAFESDNLSDLLDEKAISILNDIVFELNLTVVISSIHRLLNSIDDLNKFFKEKGFLYTIDLVTPSCGSYIGERRGKEIEMFLSDKKDYKILILDDDSDMAQYRKYLVKTDINYGLQEKHINICKKVIDDQAKEFNLV